MTTTPLAGKVALVTGGSRGIGAGIVRRLAADGAAVAFTYVTAGERALALAAEIGAAGGRVLPIQADSADAEAVQRAVAETVAAFGGLDILVNSAGILLSGTVDDYPLADFDRMIAVNVRAVFVAAQAAAPHLRDGGRIITIGSVVAHKAGRAGISVYSMTKSALVGLTLGLARDFGARGVTVNLVQPGPTITDLNPADGPHAAPLSAAIALGRLGTAEETGSFVSYLAGPESSFVTGATLMIDGGMSA